MYTCYGEGERETPVDLDVTSTNVRAELVVLKYLLN